MIGRVLGLSPGELRHATLLAAAQLTLLWRGQAVVRRGRTTTRSAFAIALWTNLFMGVFLPLGTGVALPERVRAGVWMAMGFLMTGSLVAGEFAMSLLEHRDADVLFHRPVSSRALYAGRLLQITGTVLLVTFGFFTGPAMAGFAMSGWNPLFPLLYLAGGLMQVVFLTLAILALYAFLARFIHIERVKAVAGFINAILAIGIMMSYQGQMLWARVGDSLEALRGAAWTYFVPPAWFSAPVEILYAGPQSHLVAQALIGLASVPLMAAVASGVLRRSYQERLARGLEHRRLGLHAPRRPLLTWAARLLFVRRGAETAGFELVARLYGTGKLLQATAIFFALILLAVWQGIVKDPYAPSDDLFAFMGTFYQGLLCFMMVTTAGQVRHSPYAGAAWILQTAPLGRYGDFYAGVKKAVLALSLPVYAGAFVAIGLLWPPAHALLYVAFPVVSGVLFLHAHSLWDHELPLSEEPAVGSAGTRMIVLILASLFFGVAASAAHSFAFRLGPQVFAAFWAALALALIASSGFSRWMLNRLSPLARAPE